MIIPDHSPTGALKGTPIRLMTAQTVDESVSTVICPGQGIQNHTFTVTVSDPATTGILQLESSVDPLYTGVWASLFAIIDLATIDGQLEVSISNRMIVACRARVSTVVAGGNVTVDYIGQ